MRLFRRAPAEVPAPPRGVAFDLADRDAAPAEVTAALAEHLAARTGWRLTKRPLQLRSDLGGGTTAWIYVQPHSANRRGDSVAAHLTVGVESAAYERWCAEHADLVAKRPIPLTTSVGIGYLYGDWDDGRFELLEEAGRAAADDAVVRHAVPWLTLAADPPAFVAAATPSARSVNAERWVIWLVSVGRRDAAAELAARVVTEKPAMRRWYDEGVALAGDGGRPDPQNGGQTLGWLVRTHGLA